MKKEYLQRTANIFPYCLFSCILLSPCPRWVKLNPSKSSVTITWSRKIPAKSYFDHSMESKLPLELKLPFREVETTLFPKERKLPLGVKTTLLNLQCIYIYIDKRIYSQQALTILPNICIIYLSFSLRYTGSKTISFTSSSSCETKVFQIFKAKAAKWFLADIVTEDIN